MTPESALATVAARFPLLGDATIAYTSPNTGWAYWLPDTKQIQLWPGYDYDADPRILLHEAGHALNDLAGRYRDGAYHRGTGVFDVLTDFWKARGFPGIWQEKEQLAQDLIRQNAPYPQAYQYMPKEAFAQCFAACLMGVASEEALLGLRTIAYSVPLDRARMLAFFELAHVEARSVNIPDPAGYLLSHTITQLFGVPEGVAPSGFHTGIDFGMNDGAPVPTIHGGRVRFAADAATVGDHLSGILVIVVTDGGDEWWHAHLSGVACSAGDLVRAGDVIGYVGQTGAATGPHLHLEWRHPQRTPIDPYEEVVMLSQEAQDAIRKIVQEENSRSARAIAETITSLANTTLVIRLRRLARFLKGGPYDVAGVGGTDTKGYADDTAPLG